jgi:hypothetical protein
MSLPSVPAVGDIANVPQTAVATSPLLLKLAGMMNFATGLVEDVMNDEDDFSDSDDKTTKEQAEAAHTSDRVVEAKGDRTDIKEVRFFLYCFTSAGRQPDKPA